MVTKELGSETGTFVRKPAGSETCVQTVEDLKIWMKIYETRAREDGNAQKILCMLQDFYEFSQQYVKRLHELSDDQPEENRSELWLQSAIDTALLDYWLPMRRAAQQYQVAHWAVAQAEKRYESMFVEGYQELAVQQIALTEKLNLKMEPQFVLYFEKTGKAKRFPFGNTGLIGIPLIDAYAGDWNAIPHELGHHLFWNARFSDEDHSRLPVRGTNFLKPQIEAALRQLQPEPDSAVQDCLEIILDAWTEEIFADVIGAKTGEARFVDAAWDRVRKKVPRDKKKDLFRSDGTHPMPYALPYIRAYAAGLEAANEGIAGKWKEFYDGFWYKHLVLDHEEGATTKFPLATLCLALQLYVDEIVRRLGEIRIHKVTRTKTPVAELEKFVKNMDHRKRERGVMMSLLKPSILERGTEGDGHCPYCKGEISRGKYRCENCSRVLWRNFFARLRPE